MNSTYPVGTVVQANATDAAGNVGPYASRVVTSSTSVTLPAPTINTAYDGDTIVTGTSTPNTQITLNIDGIDYTGTTGSDGSYAVAVSKLSYGAYISAKASSGSEISPTTRLMVQEAVIAKPTINQVTTNDTIVTGTADPNASITLSIPQGDGSTKNWTGTSDSSGNYAIIISKQASGTTIEVVATKNGKTSDKATTVVVQTELSAPTINGVTSSDTSISGKAEPNAVVTVAIEQAGGGYRNWEG
ncbi:Ig-like domain-containing protein, partial [Listeria floridensis]